MKDFLLTYRAGKIMLFLVFIFIGVVYINQFSNSFFDTMDDDWGIYENPLVQEFNRENLTKIWVNDTKDMFYLPVTFTSFAIDVAIWGNEAKYMKIENLVLLFVTGSLLYYLLSLVGISPLVALLSIVLFVVHPMQLESVALPTGRRQILSLLFLIWSAINYYKYLIGNSHWRYLVIAILFYTLSLGSKASSVAFFPFVSFLIFIERFYFKSKKIQLQKSMMVIIPIAIISLFFVWMNVKAGERNFLRQDFSYSPFQHVLIIFSSFGIFIKKIFIGPYIIFNPIDTHDNFRVFYYVLYSSIPLILLLLVYWSIKIKKIILAYSLLWYLLALVPSSVILIFSSDFPMNTSDRYFMLASPGIFLIITFLTLKILNRKGLIILSLFAIYLFYVSVRQLNFWQNSITLIEHNNQVFPTKDLMYKLSEVYYNNGDIHQAVLTLKEANELKIKEFFPTHTYYYLLMAKMAKEGGDALMSSQYVLKALKKDLVDFNEKYKTDDAIALIEKRMKLSDNDSLNYVNYIQFKDDLVLNDNMNDKH
ncbi:MAG: hypothetical protein M9958_00800 [Chitinophagales bacterium]|nr:hypothetical protein [Chitinophagales bacterium]